MADVVVEVEVGVVDPHRAALSERHEAQLLAESRHQVEPRGDVVAKVRVLGSRALEEGGRGDVHVRGAVLEVEERAVEAAEPVAMHLEGSSQNVSSVTGVTHTTSCGPYGQPPYTTRETDLPGSGSRLGR